MTFFMCPGKSTDTAPLSIEEQIVKNEHVTIKTPVSSNCPALDINWAWLGSNLKLSRTQAPPRLLLLDQVIRSARSIIIVNHEFNYSQMSSPMSYDHIIFS